MSLDNYPPGMSRSDMDHVEGIARCACGAVLPESVDCEHCGGRYSRGSINACEYCEGRGVIEFEGDQCPDGCADEEDPREDYDYVRDRRAEDAANGEEPI